LKTEEYTYTGAQLCVAGQLGGYSHLLLPEDPFRGWLVEEISESLQNARVELSQMGVLQAGDGQLPADLKSLVDALGAPEKSIALKHTTGDKVVSQLSMHRKEGRWLWLDQLDTERYQLKFISAEDFAQTAADFLALQGQVALPGGQIELGAETLRAARQAARDEGRNACAAELKKSGMSASQIERLARILSHPVSSGSLILINWENRIADQENALAFLEGRAGLCEISETSENRNWVMLVPISAGAGELQDKIDQVIQASK
jgi:hypothetical protein